MSIEPHLRGAMSPLLVAVTVAGLSSVSISCAGQPPESEVVDEDRGLSDAERAAVEAADRAYAEAWLANDADAVMATLTQDVVIVPSGMDPFEGPEAIRGFWFPPDSPPTTIKEYRLEQAEVAGSADIAYVRGSFTLAFDYDGESYESEGTYFSLLRRSEDGRWRIARRTWNDHQRSG